MLSRRLSFPSLSAIFAFLLAGQHPCEAQNRTTTVPQPTLAELRAGFKAPPPEARLRCYWWWLNGNTDAATITHDLEEMQAKGFGGALLVDANGASQEGNEDVPPGPTFGSKEWTALYLHALKEADRLGLEITLSMTSGWNLGGPGVKPEEASKILTWSSMPVRGGAATSIKLPMPEIKNGFYREIAVLAYPLAHGVAYAPQPGARATGAGTAPASGRYSSTSVLKLRAAGAEGGFSMPDTSDMLVADIPGDPTGAASFADASLSAVQNLSALTRPDGTLTWTAPAGQWEVLRVGYTDSDARVSTGSAGWQGLAIDYLSRTAFESYWRQTVEPLLIAAKPFHSLKSLATDSWELGGTNWTDNFNTQFQRLRGYDPTPWLPVVTGRIVESRDQSTRFLTDLRRTVADLIASEHYDVFAEKAQAYGLGMQAESGGPHGAPMDALETFRHASVTQTEFWSPNAHRPTDKDRFFTKEAASAAHIYGQRFIAAEGETSIGPQWSESLATDLKPSFDMAITEGMNRLVWHEFTSSPASTGLPGQEYFAGTHLNPKTTWWNAGGPFFTYLNRAQYLTQQGLAVADLLYYYGDNVPNFARLKSDDPAHVLPGYDYDVTNEDALLHTIQIDGGKLRGPSGVEWRALALPATRRLSVALLERVERYVAEGGTVIGTAPESATGRELGDRRAAFQSLVGKIWGQACAPGSDHSYGKGRVFCTQDAHAALTAMNVLPDVALAQQDRGRLGTASDSALDYIHQRVGDTDLYFVRNGSSTASSRTVDFRVTGELPEVWDAGTGEMKAAPGAHLLPDGRAEVSLELPPFGSSVLVFAPAIGRAASPPSRSTQVLPVAIAGPWKVQFQRDRGGPNGTIKMPTLKSWTESSDPAVRYFSGTATYVADFTAPIAKTGDAIWLRFPEIREIAHVKINGKDAGTVWAKPLTLQAGPFLKPGVNRIEIEVTNLWPNRVIGDAQPGVTKRITSTNITKYKAESPLLPSGLIGDLQWVIER